jgi:large subunit ribosomal protein L31
MKSDLHPEYRPVVFRDRSAELAFLTRSTKSSDTTVEWEDGNTYPVIDVEISSASHPFYTGKQKLIDTGGRLGRFQAKLDALSEAPETSAKKKKANVRTFTPAVDPKVLAAKAARAEAKALEDAKKRKEAEEAAAAEREAAAQARAEAEAAAAAAPAAPEAEAADAPAAADDAPVVDEAAEATPEEDSAE